MVQAPTGSIEQKSTNEQAQGERPKAKGTHRDKPQNIAQIAVWVGLAHVARWLTNKFQAGSLAVPPDRFANPRCVVVYREHETSRHRRVAV